MKQQLVSVAFTATIASIISASVVYSHLHCHNNGVQVAGLPPQQDSVSNTFTDNSTVYNITVNYPEKDMEVTNKDFDIEDYTKSPIDKPYDHCAEYPDDPNCVKVNELRVREKEADVLQRILDEGDSVEQKAKKVRSNILLGEYRVLPQDGTVVTQNYDPYSEGDSVNLDYQEPELDQIGTGAVLLAPVKGEVK